jgi:hypothetical protein
MRSLTNRIDEAKQKLDIQDNSINFIDNADLRRYLDVAGKFLSPEATDVVNWLINNNNYVSRFGGSNALETFYNSGTPKDADLKKLYNDISKVVKANRLLEIPVFQTAAQFNDIITNVITPDEIILDLETEKGRNEIAKRYDKLVWKIARSFVGKSTLTLDELYESGLQGLVQAMNNYGKKTEFTKGADNSVKTLTFFSFAGYAIRFQILHDIKNNSHIVRVPVSAQQREKAETGSNVKSNTVSGDKAVNNGESGSKTLFDFVGADGGDSADNNINKADREAVWKEIYKELESKFDARTMDIWYSFNELKGHKKMKNKDLGTKYNMMPSRVTYYLYIVNSYILKNKKLRNLFMDLRELVGESHTIKDNERHILDR